MTWDRSGKMRLPYVKPLVDFRLSLEFSSHPTHLAMKAWLVCGKESLFLMSHNILQSMTLIGVYGD